MKELAPSILSADFSELGEEIKRIEDGGAHLIHFDVMDGHFVPNISYGPVVLKALSGKTELPFDVHLMIDDPDDYIEEFVSERTRYITVHSEACRHLDRTLEHIKKSGALAGVALNPATPICAIENILGKADLVLIMSVNPGFGGQRFIEYTLEKTRAADALRREKGYDFKIEMDGGIDTTNAAAVTGAGTDIVVAGSAVFGAKDINGRIREFIAAMGD